MDEKILEKYIYSASKLLDVRFKIQSEDEFNKQLNLSGISEQELQFVREQGEYYKAQARTLFMVKRYAAAAEAIDKVLSILPFDTEVYSLGAKANYKAYFETKDLNYLNKALTYVRQGFVIAPQVYFFPKMEDIIKETLTSAEDYKNYTTYRTISLVFLVVGIFTLLGAVFAFIAFLFINKKYKKAKNKLETLESKADYLDIL